MGITISKDIPIPQPKKRGRPMDEQQKAMFEMEVGDSFFSTYKEPKLKTYARKAGIKIVLAPTSNGRRVWRKE